MKNYCVKRFSRKWNLFFHGKSSGLDPLNSYLNIPILINSKDNIGTFRINTKVHKEKVRFFLIDSGIVGRNSSMVSIFMENLKDNGFRTMLKSQFIKYTDACVENFLHGDVKSLLENASNYQSDVEQFQTR